MSKWVDNNHVISEVNVRQYIDETSDGGYWYKIVDGEPVFVDITQKALNILGYESFSELLKSGKNPRDLIAPINHSEKSMADYEDFLSLNRDKFQGDCVFRGVKGEEYPGQVFVARSKIFPNQDTDPIYRAMMTIYDNVEAVFRQSKRLLDDMSSGVAILKNTGDNVYELTYANEGYCKIVKCNREYIQQFMGVDVMEYAYEDDKELIHTVYEDAISTGKNIKSTYRIIDMKGNVAWIKAEHRKINVGKDIFLIVYFMDITNLMNIQMAMQTDNERLVSFINNTPAGIVVFNKVDGTYITRAINATLIASLNRLNIFKTPDERAKERRDYDGKTLDEFVEYVDPIDRDVVKKFIEKAEKDGEAECKFRVLTNSSVKKMDVWVRCKLKAVQKKNAGMQLIAVYEDISRSVKAEEELITKQAKILNMNYHDALTGVLNRLSYNEYIKKNGHRRLKNVGVGFIDINGLKVINNLYGHSKGDDAINLTVILMEYYFEKDEIYRLSGDNFVVIKEGISQQDFYRKMDQLLMEFAKYDIASIGYNWNEVVTDIEKNIDKAEAAERVAKQEYYVNHREDMSKNRPAELNTLMEDLHAGRYVMYLQPKAYTENTKVVAAESLIRKIDRDGRVIPPVEFVPVLEKARLVPHLDFFMLEETCKTLEKWNEKSEPSIKISVNMSRVTLAEPDYINKVLSITDKYDINHSQIEFEITESQETMDRHKLEEIVIKISDLGFGVSLDDMGTEYSSVMMLAMKGIDTVKIDRGFVLQMNTDEGKTLVQHIIRMCHDLGEICIAEGVEDDDTRSLLYDMGCDMYQGYLLAKPIPVAEFEKMVRQQQG